MSFNSCEKYERDGDLMLNPIIARFKRVEIF